MKLIKYIRLPRLPGRCTTRSLERNRSSNITNAKAEFRFYFGIDQEEML